MNDFTKDELIFIHDLIHDYLLCRDDVYAEKLMLKANKKIKENFKILESNNE